MEARSTGQAPTEKAQLANRVLELIADPRSTARQIGRIIDGLPALRGAVINTARVHCNGRGIVRTCAHAVILIGYNHLSRLVALFLSELKREITTLTDGPHRLRAPTSNLVPNASISP